jgi:hypothetical protein
MSFASPNVQNQACPLLWKASSFDPNFMDTIIKSRQASSFPVFPLLLLPQLHSILQGLNFGQIFVTPISSFPPATFFLSLFLDYLLCANASWNVIMNLWILILWTLSLRTFGKLKIVWIIARFAFWVCGLIQFLKICGTLIDQEINIHGWASFLHAWLMFMHVEEVKALVISSLQRLVVQCQVPTWPIHPSIHPWHGGDNHVAIDLIVQHIRTKLGQHNLHKIYPNVYVIQSTFQVCSYFVYIECSNNVQRQTTC